MGTWRVGCFMVIVLVLILGCGSLASGYYGSKQPSWRKAMLSGEAMSSSIFMANRVGPSVVFQLHGNVYPIGFYNVTLNIGQPPRPYFLDVDTGSDLTWLQCDAPCVRCTEAPHPYYRPRNNLVPCRDPICEALQSSNGDHRCETPEQCDYELSYADGGSTLGVLVKDMFPLNFTNGMRASPFLAFGCGYDQLPGNAGANHPLDGILGLGRGRSTILTQLSSQGLVKNVIGHCLSGRGGGFLFFGDGVYDSSRVAWTPMSREYTKDYSPGYAEMIFAGKSTGIRNLLVTFDSGSSYSYLNSQAYEVLISLVRKDASKSLKEAYEDQTLPLCWKGRRPFRSVKDVRKYFKSFAFSFTSGGKTKTKFEFSPEAYLIISSKGNVCLAILNGTEIGLNTLNIIGDVSMQDKMVIYDNDKQAIGWIPANCDRIPKSSSSI